MSQNKKTQLFLFDAILGFTLIVIALGVVFTYYSSKIDNTNIYAINQNLMNSFSKTQINQLNDLEIREFFKQGKIRNVHNSIAQQATEFYHTGDTISAKNLTDIFVRDFISRQMNAIIELYDNTTINSPFVLYQIENRRIPLQEAEAISSTKRSILGFINTSENYGPYTLEITIWQ